MSTTLSCQLPSNAVAPRGLSASLVAAIRATWHSYRTARAKRLSVAVLSGLDRHTLKDIGLTPGEVESVVYGQPGDRLQQHDDRWPSTRAAPPRCAAGRD